LFFFVFELIQLGLKCFLLSLAAIQLCLEDLRVCLVGDALMKLVVDNAFLCAAPAELAFNNAFLRAENAELILKFLLGFYVSPSTLI
jgi:hypothetical protein